MSNFKAIPKNPTVNNHSAAAKNQKTFKKSQIKVLMVQADYYHTTALLNRCLGIMIVFVGWVELAKPNMKLPR